jgi:hypothetical protein
MLIKIFRRPFLAQQSFDTKKINTKSINSINIETIYRYIDVF